MVGCIWQDRPAMDIEDLQFLFGRDRAIGREALWGVCTSRAHRYRFFG